MHSNISLSPTLQATEFSSYHANWARISLFKTTCILTTSTLIFKLCQMSDELIPSSLP
jgi:hypothetical protein